MVTDERRKGAVIEVSLDGTYISCVCLAGDSSDKRALFSNSTMYGEPYKYVNLGRLDTASGLPFLYQTDCL